MSSIDPAIQTVLNAQQSAANTKIQFTLAAKALNVTKAQGAAMLQLLDSAANVGKSNHTGHHFDTIS